MGTYARNPIVLETGRGPWVYDAEGKRYLDFLGGIAVNILGHCHPAVVGAIRDQAARLIHTSNLYHTAPQAELAALLTRHSFGDKVFFCNSGAEANEGAIKLARKYARKIGGENKYEIITALHSFHGRTLATLAATGHAKYRQGFEPMPAGFINVPFNDLEAVKAAITANTAAIMVEPVQGEGGIYPASKAYLEGLAALAKEKGLTLIFDEIQCGLGRTGDLFAYQTYGVEPDIMTLAKGLGGGLPIGAFIAGDEVASALKPGDHGSTFGGNPVACAAALATVKTILDENLPINAARVGSYFLAKLQTLKGKFEFVREVRGVGLMVGIELDVEGKAAVDFCREMGLLINCTEGKILRFLPPINITEDHVDQAVDIIGEALAKLAEKTT